MLSKLSKEFVSDLKKCVDVAKRQRHIQLYSHYDADGITSAAIISIALDRAGIANLLWTFPTLSDWEMRRFHPSGGTA